MTCTAIVASCTWGGGRRWSDPREFWGEETSQLHHYRYSHLLFFAVSLLVFPLAFLCCIIIGIPTCFSLLYHHWYPTLAFVHCVFWNVSSLHWYIPLARYQPMLPPLSSSTPGVRKGGTRALLEMLSLHPVVRMAPQVSQISISFTHILDVK